MENTFDSVHHQHLRNHQSGSDGPDISGFRVPELNVDNGSLAKLKIMEPNSKKHCDPKDVKKNEDNISKSGNSTPEDDYISVSSDDDVSGYTDSNLSKELKNTQNGGVKEFTVNDDNVLNASLSQSDRLAVSRLSTWRPEQGRLRSLSRISEGSHTSIEHETKDDLPQPASKFGHPARTDHSINSSESTLTGSDHDQPDDQQDIFYDAQASNGHSGESFSDKKSDFLHQNDNVIMSGNVRNGYSGNRSSNPSQPKVNLSPLSTYNVLNTAEVASESTPMSSNSVIFKFPHIKPSPQKSTSDISMLSDEAKQSTPLQQTTKSNENVKMTKPTTILTEATIHDTRSEVSDIPLSLRNLAFLTTPEPPLLATAKSSSLTAINPGFLLANERKRSNLKKKSNTSTASSDFLSAHNANNSIDGSSSSLNIIGSKKSIKWGSDVPDTKASNELHLSAPQDASKSQSQPISKEALLNRDSSRKVSAGSNASTMDKNNLENPAVETQERKDSKAARRDTTKVDEADKGKDKDGCSSRASSGYSTPVKASGHRELGGNLIVKALKGLKGKVQNGSEDKNSSYIGETDEDVISMGVIPASGGLSTPGDVTPKDYLSDVEDTVTSFDELERRDKRGISIAHETTTTDAQDSTLHEFPASDDVFRPTSATTRNAKTKNRFLPESLKNSLVVILSGFYGITIVVLGLVLPLSETFANPEHPYFFEIFYLYLYVASMAFLLYVYTYLLRKERSLLQTLPKTISRTLSRTFSRSSMRSRSSVASEKPGPATSKPLVRHNSSQSANSYRRRRKIAFNSEVSHHAGSLYLRVGVIGFGIGSMIHSALVFGHYFEVSHLASHCSDAIQAIKPFAHLCFTFVQMYFIFMNSKMCVHKYKTLARFGLIHMSCTNICVWLRSVVVETLQVIKVDQRETYNAIVQAFEEHKTNSGEDSEDSDEQELVQTLEEYLQEHHVGSVPEINCKLDSMMGQIVENSSVYLYPCTIEYSLVCACVLYVMWSNVGESNTARRKDSCSEVDDADSIADSDDELAHHRMSVDCAASSRGLFLGILLLVAAVVCVVCFYVLTSVTSHVSVGTLLGHVSEQIILIVAFIATVIAAFQMRRMRYSGKRKVGLEEILTLVSISGLGLYGIWSIIAAMFHLDTLHGRLTLVTNLFMLIQAGSQATFTLAALRASPRNHEQLRGKPGRQCVTFLLVCNFALWVVNTFETQRIEYNQTQVHFYGTTAWAIFSHISVPLGIYFRFNSTVNLSIIWKKAWKKKDAQEETNS